MFITGVFPSCLRAPNSDDDDSDPKQKSDADSDSGCETGVIAPHNNEKIFYVDNFHRVKETQTKMKFQTRCPVLPSSWQVIVDLTISDVFHKFHILITMMRIDSGQIPLEGMVVVWFLNANGKTCPISYRVCDNIPYKIKPSKYSPLADTSKSVHETFFVDKHFECLFTEDFAEIFSEIRLPKDLLIVKIQLFIRGCCDCKKDNKGSKMDSGGEGKSKMDSGGEGTSKMDSGGKGTSKMDSGGKGTSKMDSGGKGTSKMDSGGEGTSMMDSGGEGTSKMSCLSKL